MYPYYHLRHWSRGPSRILWFIIGAASATWWIKRKDTDRRIFGHCMRPSIPHPLPNPNDPASPSQAPPPSWPQTISDIPRAITSIPPSPAPPVTYSPTPIGHWEKQQDTQWDLEKEHLANISRQAADAMADLTESTLESVLSTAESLKAKLAEHRAQREKQQRIIQEELDRQRRDPPRLV